VKRACLTIRLDSRRRPHPGLTMIELLIVVAVMVILIGIALPVMKTGIEARRLREASRQVNTAVTLAKSLAAETDRYAGLLIDVESLPEDRTKLFARRLYLAETPPPYAGDMVGATAAITAPFQATFLDANSANLVNVVNDGDLIRFDHRNPYYRINDPPPPGTLPPFALNLSGPPFWPEVKVPPLELSYEIIRSPEKSSSTPFELPSGAVIDLNNSGSGLTDISLSRGAPAAWMASFAYQRGIYCQPTMSNGFNYVAVAAVSPFLSAGSEPVWPTTLGKTVVDNNITWRCVAPRPVTVVFGPSGRMTGVMGLTPAMSNMPTETLHLLIGDLENIGALNLANGSGLWVSVGHHTGRITTAENAGAAPVWTASTAYASGAYCQPTSLNGLCFIATAAGISGAAEPAWATTGTVADGGVTWRCRAPLVWNGSTAYRRGDFCRPTTPNGFCYVARLGGTPGGSEPAWPVELGTTIVDGGILWECTLYMEPAREFAQSAQAMGGQ